LTRPKKRADCVDGPRPCPYVSCRHHLGIRLSVRLTEPGAGRLSQQSVKEVWPDLADAEYTCSLDAAEQNGGMSLGEVASIMNITKQRVGQIEKIALAKLRARKEDFDAS